MNRLSLGRLAAWSVAILAGVLAIGWGVLRIAERKASAQAVPRPVAARGALQASEQATIDLFERTRVSVVHITTQARVVDMWTRNTFNVPRGTGSGFIWDARGHVVTNNHVVAGASGARVRLSDGRDAAASLVGVSPAHDLAVLRIDVTNFPVALPLGTSADLRVGQNTYAIGNPFGLDWTLDHGNRFSGGPVLAVRRWTQPDRASDSDRRRDQSREFRRATARQRRASDWREHGDLQPLRCVFGRRLCRAGRYRQSSGAAVDRCRQVCAAVARDRSG